MPPNGHEIGLTQLEVDLMGVFVKHKIFNDRHSSVLLMQLADKLEEAYRAQQKEKDLADR